MYGGITMPRKEAKIFISYAQEDQVFVSSLMQAFDSVGVKYWSDKMDLTPGTQWKTEIESAMNEASVFILIISPSFTKSNFTMLETGFALSRSLDTGARIIPIIARDTIVPPLLREFQHLDGRTLGPTGVANEIKLLLKADERRGLLANKEKGSASPSRTLKIFVSSPSDVMHERDGVSQVAKELNRSLGDTSNISLEVIRWEFMPAFDQTPQEILSLSAIDADVFVTILHSRIGTPLPAGISGTEEEFRTAYESWKRTGQPQVLIYFKTTPVNMRSIEQLEQMRGVVEFRDQIKETLPYYEFESTNEFMNQLRRHLTQIVVLEKNRLTNGST